MIRHGNLYAHQREIDKFLLRIISKEKHHIFRSSNKWRTAILSAFGYDPLICPDCDHSTDFSEHYFNNQRISCDELYERAMSKSLGKPSSS